MDLRKWISKSERQFEINPGRKTLFRPNWTLQLVQNFYFTNRKKMNMVSKACFFQTVAVFVYRVSITSLHYGLSKLAARFETGVEMSPLLYDV